MKKILLIDDHEITRAGLKILIENMVPGTEVSDAGDERGALQKVREGPYQLVLMDVNIPGTDSSRLLAEILKLQPETNVLMFSMNAEVIYAKKYLRLGAKGYIAKTAREEELRDAIYTVLQKGRYVSPTLRNILVEEQLSGTKPGNPFSMLSVRELEIFRHLMTGKTATEISASLGLGMSTVGTYKGRILKKVNCSNTIELNTLARLYDML